MKKSVAISRCTESASRQAELPLNPAQPYPKRAIPPKNKPPYIHIELAPKQLSAFPEETA
jgi:hypothetical protein